MSEEDFPDIHLRVLYDFEYVKDKRTIRIQEGEKLFLIKKTNSDWWQVIRSSSERPFFVPAAYVEEYSCNPSKVHVTSSRVKEVLLEGKEKQFSLCSPEDKKVVTHNFKKVEQGYDTEGSTDVGKFSSYSESHTSEGKSSTVPIESTDKNIKMAKLDSFSKRSTNNNILLDKRKSWAVEELVSELSKMTAERNIPPPIDLCTKPENEEKSEESVYAFSDVQSKQCVENTFADDKPYCSSKQTLSLEKDKTDNTSRILSSISSGRNVAKMGQSYSTVLPVSPEVSKTVDNDTHHLTESLEKLAEQIKFEPNITCRNRALSMLTTNTDEPKVAAVDDIAKGDSVFKRVKSKLSYSSSLKTKRELQQGLKHRTKNSGRNSVLSTSWENKLPDTISKRTEDYCKVVEDIRKLNSGRVLDSVKGETEEQEDKLEESHSGCELDISHHSTSQNRNVVDQYKCISAKKEILRPSGSESEDNLNDSIGRDEGSISGLSDDILLDSSATNKISYSDISDGAISDGFLLESTRKENSKKSGGNRSRLKSQKRRVSLTRRNRVESHSSHHSSSPPSPSPGCKPVRVLHEGWEEHLSSQGRTYYYNNQSHDKRWKPPRKQSRQQENTDEGSTENLRSDTSSPLLDEGIRRRINYIPVPQGWRETFDEESGQPCYINDISGAKWFSSNDSEGRIYFFEENSNESSWTLPALTVTGCDSSKQTVKPDPQDPGKEKSKITKDVKHKLPVVELRTEHMGIQPEMKIQHRMTKAHSMVLVDSRGKPTPSKSSSFPRNWPQLWDGNMCVLKEGTLNKTKITDNGKKLRKNWAPAHVVLTELFLLFFKDAKAFASMKSSSGDSSSSIAQPELCVDLNGALLEPGEKHSSRRNVFLVSTVLGLQVLLQFENSQQEDDWYEAIHKVIIDLPSGIDSLRNNSPKKSPQLLRNTSPDESKRSSRIGRSRSVKLKLSKDGSQEDLTASTDEQQTKIRNRLKKFFHRRPTKETLVKKGIYKDEPVFGCNLQDACRGESPRVPPFVVRCIAAIECKVENMKTDGLYRASGNLSQVQKIRLQVDQNNLEILTQEEDVHVLTGALKLFFRELKKPLIPFEHFNKALRASTNPNKKEKLQQFREIVKALPIANRDTLEYLLKHLLRVTEFQEYNRMHIPNLAIVFGPTLMWPEAESLNMALDLMQQNLVIECFLQEFNNFFR